MALYWKCKTVESEVLIQSQIALGYTEIRYLLIYLLVAYLRSSLCKSTHKINMLCYR